MNDQIPQRARFVVEVTDDGWIFDLWIPPDPTVSMRGRLDAFLETLAAQRALAQSEDWNSEEASQAYQDAIGRSAQSLVGTGGSHRREHYAHERHSELAVRMVRATLHMVAPEQRAALLDLWEQRERDAAQQIVDEAREAEAEA